MAVIIAVGLAVVLAVRLPVELVAVVDLLTALYAVGVAAAGKAGLDVVAIIIFATVLVIELAVVLVIDMVDFFDNLVETVDKAAVADKVVVELAEFVAGYAVLFAAEMVDLEKAVVMIAELVIFLSDMVAVLVFDLAVVAVLVVGKAAALMATDMAVAGGLAEAACRVFV